MKGRQQDVEIDTNISYSLTTQSFNKHLRLQNHSDHTYVFKIKTNQKTVISLQTTHDFILPHSIRQIAIRLADKPSNSSQLKLEFNYALARQEDIQNKDSKMIGYAKEDIFRLVVPVHRSDNVVQQKSEEAELTKPVENVPSVKKEEERTQQKAEEMGTVKQEIDFGSPRAENKGTIEPEPSTKFQITPERIQQPPVTTTRMSQPVQFKKVESQQLKIEPISAKPADPEATTSIYLPAHEYNETSPSKYVSQTPSSSKNEEERQLKQLEQKLAKERSTIRNLQYSSSSNSVFPFPIIILCLIASFCMGSFLNYLVA